MNGEPDIHIPEDIEHSECSDADNTKNTDAKRCELIKLSEEGEISQSVKSIKKASNKVICKIYSEYEYKQADNANTFLADMLIVKFSELMSGLGAVGSGDDLTNELRNDKMLQKNIKSAISFLTPFIPFLGLVSGGATLGKHVMKHRSEVKESH